jgi:hypothetical protein
MEILQLYRQHCQILDELPWDHASLNLETRIENLRKE